MENDIKYKVQPSDSFTEIYKLLAFVGFCKSLNKPQNKFAYFCHQIYRIIAFSICVIFNAHYLVFMWQNRHDVDILFDSLAIEIPQLNLIMKLLVLNLGSSALSKVHDLMNDPIFKANSEKDEQYLAENATLVRRMLTAVNVSCTITATFWTLSHLYKRLQDPNVAAIPAYFPFDTTTWFGFSLSLFLETGSVVWVGYGHLSMDCLIAAYYSQIRVQLKIIKYNLEHLTDTNEIENMSENSNRIFHYIDDAIKNIHERFCLYVRRYERVIWFTNEVSTIFNNAIVFQFLSSSSTTCLVIYKLSYTHTFSASFIFLVLLFVVLQTQIFLYCFFGGFVQYESNSVANSLYLSDWLSLSPRFRRQLLIAMSRWSLPITPRVSSVIPLSLTTFITIVRSAYTLYTVLKTSNK